ncbi:MAG: sulfatase-like hydrolase/transferase [Verrucomicrobiae bacterium]|nr:sulfatase-like hydrolase/transferase [Verrucomicrobiae bacterium]
MKLIAFLFATACALGCSSAAPRSWQQPNFVILVAEDLGREWLGCYGGQELKTTEIDRLAANGARFETCYAAPMPSISKVELLTGRYPFRSGWMWENDVPKSGPPELDPGREIVFARLLKDVGYTTGFAGVWNLNRPDEEGGLFRRHGFDRALPSGNLGAISDFVSGFLEESREAPFAVCAFLPSAASGAGFKDHVLGLNELVGRLMQRIHRLKLDSRTIVILTSACGTDGLVAKAWNNLHVKGGKGTLREVGINVPLIVSGSYWVKRGEVIRHLADFTDLLPTLLDLAGARPPKDRVIDGRSFAEALSGRELLNPREWILSQQGGDRVVRNPRYKLYSSGRYYDVLADPLESANLARTSNSEMIAERERLAAILRALPRDEPLAFPYARRIIVRRPQ